MNIEKERACMRFIRFWIYMCIEHPRGTAFSSICASVEVEGKLSSDDSRACHSADPIMVGLDGGRIVLHLVVESQLFASGMRVWVAITVEHTTE